MIFVTLTTLSQVIKLTHDKTLPLGFTKKMGQLDIAFANAGTELGDADIETVKLEDWNKLIGINLTGAMLTTLDGQLTPASYQPLRFTFLIWVMVIVGGSANNWGAVLGGFVIWFFWIEAEPLGLWLMDVLTSGMATDNPLRLHLIESAAHMRLMTMGLILLLALRFSPRGLIPERRQ